MISEEFVRFNFLEFLTPKETCYACVQVGANEGLLHDHESPLTAVPASPFFEAL